MITYGRFAMNCTAVIAAAAMFLTASSAYGHIELDAPNGGEQLEVGSMFTIEWHILIQHNQLNWDLWYSTTGPNGPWIVIATDLPPGPFGVGSVHTYDWVIPDAVSDQVRVRVRMDNAGTDYFDISDGDLSILPEAIITPPAEFSAFRGFLNSGTLADVLESDDVDLCHDLGITIFPSEAPITLDFEGTLPNDSPSTLDVTIESSANTPGLGLTILFWNFNTASWDVVGTAAQGFNADTVRTFSGTPADHVEAGTGAVRTRYEVRQVGIIFQFPWTDCIDQFFWTTVG